MRRALFVVTALLFTFPAKAADQIDPATEYRTCLTLAKTKPEDGWEEALAWTSLGGGEPARHCAAVALIGLHKYEDAATRLETLASESRRPEAIRAEMLAQAGQAWLLAERYDRADAAQRTALKLVPGHPELLLDHAVTLAQVHHYKEAADELSDLLRRQPNRVEALVLRATAYRFLDDPIAARSDIDRALALDPGFPDALVERGILHRLDGDAAAAREDWLKVVRTLTSGAALSEAQRNLELLDVKTK
jgi:tetratricopeptide (TPR) repeat protein